MVFGFLLIIVSFDIMIECILRQEGKIQHASSIAQTILLVKYYLKLFTQPW